MVDLPALPADLSVAPLTPADVDDAAALLVAAEAVDDTGEHWSAEDLTEWWVNDLVDLRRDGVAVRDPDGALVAWATVLALPTFRDAFRIDLEARVHPARRGEGLGRALLGWQVARGREIHVERHPDSPAVLAVSAPPPCRRWVRCCAAPASERSGGTPPWSAGSTSCPPRRSSTGCG